MKPPATAPEIFNRRHIRQRRDRAAENIADYNFLHKWAGNIVADRLRDIKRNFPASLQIGVKSPPRTLKEIKDAAGCAAVFTMDIAEAPLYTTLPHPVFQADEEFLPVKNGALDMVFSIMNLHTVNDLPGALIQINRALKPDGLFIAAMPGGETLYELRQCLNQAEIKIKGGMSPRVAPFADKQQMGALMQRAGYALPVVDSELLTVTYDSLFALMRDLRGMGESSAIMGRQGTFTGKKMFAEAEDLYKQNYSDPDGRLQATFEIIFLIGWHPDETQQKPMRPGSAKNRLADTLQTEETKI